MAGKSKYDWPSDKDLAALVEKLGQHGAAESLGIPRPTLQSRLYSRKIKVTRQNAELPEKPIDDPDRLKVTQLEAENKAMRRDLKAYSTALSDQEAFFQRIVEATKMPVKTPDFTRKPQPKGKPKNSVVLPIFDQQFGQFVREEDTPGNKGHYSVAEFDRRLARYVEGVKGVIADRAESYNLDEMIIAMGGDHLEGDEIFAGQAWQLELHPIEQAWQLAGKMEAAIRDLTNFGINEVGVRKIAIYGVDDNHGKVGGKKSGARPATYSWNYLFLNLLGLHLRAEPIDQFAIEPGGALFFRCAGHEFQLIHGHQIRGWGGLPFYGLTKFDGRSIRLHQRVYRYLLMGHHHQPATIPNGSGETIVSGDWVGANNLSGMITAASRPQQNVLFVAPKWGIAGVERIYFTQADDAYEPTPIYEV